MRGLSSAEKSTCGEVVEHGGGIVILSIADLKRVQTLLRMAVERIDDWEFYFLVGLDQSQVLAVADKIDEVLLDTPAGE